MNSDTKNTAKAFWSGLHYIIDSVAKHGEPQNKESFDRDCKSITLSNEEWETIQKHFSDLEKVILDTFEDACRLADDLEEMKWLHPDDAEAFRKADLVMAESILNRLDEYVDEEKVET